MWFVVHVQAYVENLEKEVRRLVDENLKLKKQCKEVLKHTESCMSDALFTSEHQCVTNTPFTSFCSLNWKWLHWSSLPRARCEEPHRRNSEGTKKHEHILFASTKLREDRWIIDARGLIGLVCTCVSVCLCAVEEGR